MLGGWRNTVAIAPAADPGFLQRHGGTIEYILIPGAALAGALVVFGSVITIRPGIGAVSFCAVVILTMIAAETFDPRLMWDAAAGRASGGALDLAAAD